MITKKALFNTFKKALNTSTLSTHNVQVDHKLSHSYEGVITISPLNDFSIDIDQNVKPKEMILSFRDNIIAGVEDRVREAIQDGKTTVLAKPFLINDPVQNHSIDNVVRNNHYAQFDEIVLNNGLVVLVMIKEEYRDEITHNITDDHVKKFAQMRKDGRSMEEMEEEYIKDVKSTNDKTKKEILTSYLLDFAIFMR